MTRASSSRIINTSRYPAFFSSFQVKDCWDEMGPIIQGSLHDMIDKCTQPGTRERKRALYRHSNPAGNLFGVCLALCKPERFGIVAKLIEFLCIIDDVLEDLPHEEAVIEHDILCETLCLGFASQLTRNTRPEWLSFLPEIKEEMLLLDPIRSPSLLQTFEASLQTRDSSAIEFDTIEEYIPYRLVNFDFEFVSQLILWAMALDLSPEDLDLDLLPTYKYSIGVIVGLVNDYFSWNMEKLQLEQDGDRIRNAVAVLLRQYAISERQAQAEVKKIIVGEEAKVRSLFDRHVTAMSEGMRRYLEQLQLFASGYSFWCATAPRYIRAQDLLESDSDQSSDSD
uniref:Terpenoid synthase n=2 Tax=Moniliophthora roreri TaxID=221103 RepID=A0A0W0G6D9_MONRR